MLFGAAKDRTASSASGDAPDLAIDPPRVPDAAHVPEPAAAVGTVETRADRFRRIALQVRLHAQAVAIVVLVAVLVALAASNTADVKVNWLIGSSRISLVWLVLLTAIVAWLLGLLASVRFQWLTRARRR